MIRPCLEPGCPHPSTYRGRCQIHARKWNASINRVGRQLYNTKRWRLTRRRQLADHPLCQCDNPSCTLIATDVDHVIALEQGGDPWAETNLQSLARACHARKTRREQLAGGGS